MLGSHDKSAWLAVKCALAAAACGLAWQAGLQGFFGSCLKRCLQLAQAAGAQSQDEADYIPDEYRDPITYDIMQDPVVLCATGQVYDYSSLRQWFAAGNFRCPKTNLDVFDAHVTRLPWLKHNILDWLRTHNHPLPPDPYPTIADIESFQPQLAVCIKGIRGDTGVQRSAAAAALVRQLRRWMDSTAPDDAEAAKQQEAVRSFVMEDMLWMVRYGDEYLQGVAASVLACCCLDGELSWLAATAVVPLVALLYTGNSYSQEWSLQTLYKICLAVPSSRPLLWRAGCVQGLLQLLSLDKAHVPFHRDRAAVMLATMAQDHRVKSWLQDYGVVPLVKMLLESTDRWEQRDAAFALLALHLEQHDLQLAAAAVVAHNPSLLQSQPDGQDELSADTAHASNAAAANQSSSSSSSRGNSNSSQADDRSHSSERLQQLPAGPRAVLVQQGMSKLDRELLLRFRWCSQKYLDGEVDEPDAGLTADEIRMRDAYEAALTQYGHVHGGLELVQQQHEEPQQPEAEHAGLQREPQQQQQGQQQHMDAQQNQQPLLQQEEPRQQRQRQQLRGHGVRPPMHWMAEHDADGGSGAADDTGLLAGDSSSSSGSESSGSSTEFGGSVEL